MGILHLKLWKEPLTTASPNSRWLISLIQMLVTVSLHDPMDGGDLNCGGWPAQACACCRQRHPCWVISRSDLLQHMKIPREKDYGGAEEFPSSRLRAKSVKRLLEEHFPDGVIRILRTAGEVAQKRGVDVYLVGGAVRDLLLRKYNLDIDLVVEGEVISVQLGSSRSLPRV